ncbi:hypothetical protein KJ742_03330 [Patescibacteria group bacterium]|nr:hypothetical protein [Patescibacteria group bacterium]MBU1682952.1 hypothetical protein [Patescibacteria group bacterium]MBU1934918.1 hypothetical protein [Patescibacteria group bacterium]
MDINEIPKINMDDNETGCCPRFDPAPWNDKEFIFDNKLFAKATTINFFHFPLNMGSMYKGSFKKIMDANAMDEAFITLSYDPSPWKGEHYFAVNKDVPGMEMIKLSGVYLSKVFEGPFKDAGKWVKEMGEFVKSKGKEQKKLYFFYTTCPKCAKHYGKNYVVAFGEV